MFDKNTIIKIPIQIKYMLLLILLITSIKNNKNVEKNEKENVLCLNKLRITNRYFNNDIIIYCIIYITLLSTYSH